MLENLTGGGVNGSGNSDVRGGLTPQILPRGLLSSIFGSLRSLSVDDFEVLLCVFKLSYSFNLQTSYHIYFEFPSIDFITRVKEDQYRRY